MMQTRLRSSRRNKVTIRWLPVELILEIFRRVQKLIGRCDFKQDCWKSMQLDQEYCNNLLVFARSSKEWSAIAQAELFRNIILKNRSKTGQFLELVRDNKELRSHAETAVSVRFGGDSEGDYDAEGLDDDLNEIALYCPTIVEISCYRVDVRLEYFRNMKKLDKLNVAFRFILPPSASEARLQPFTLSITRLSLHCVNVPSRLEPSSLPLVRSLQLTSQTHQSIRLLLPHLDSLHIHHARDTTDINLSLQASTSITSLSIREGHMVHLDDTSKTILKDTIVEFRLILGVYADSSNRRIVDFRFLLASMNGETGGSTLTTIISGSKVMKKVIVDGFNLSVEDQVKPRYLEKLKSVMEACKKKKIELWKENFKVGNGNVNLEEPVVIAGP